MPSLRFLNQLHQRLLLKKPSFHLLLSQQSAYYQSRRPITSLSHRTLLNPGVTALKPSLVKANYSQGFTALQTQQAALSSWTLALLLGLVSSVLLTLSSSSTTVRQPQQEPNLPTLSSSSSPIILNRTESNMTQESQPGRPGTLTPEQDEKLRQFWIAASRVFGIIDDKFIEELNKKTNGTATPDTKDKPKKRLGGIFSRKHKNDSDADSTTSADTDRGRAVSVGEDKYGQTKQYYDAISQQTPESLRKTCWSMVKHDHPDALLLRFLRARRWDVEKALIMMVSTMNWRANEAHVDDDVMFNGEEGAVLVAKTKDEEAIKRGAGDDFMAQLRMGKSFFHGMDVGERPICYVRARLHRAGEQSEPSLERATFYQIETARMMLAPPVDTATIFFDMTGFTLSNMDYAPVKFMIKCFEANYPESLGVVLVHRAPWVFQGVWKIIKGWLDPVVASKVHFTNDLTDLVNYIPKTRLPKEFGGDEDWEYKYVEPIPGENERMKDVETRERLLKEREGVVTRFEEVTRDWIAGVEKGIDPGEIAQIKQRRHEIAKELRVGYWKLDPYIRARSFYDRTGVLKEGGVVDYYPKSSETKTAPIVEGSKTPQAVEATTTPTAPAVDTIANTNTALTNGEAESKIISPTSVQSFKTASENGNAVGAADKDTNDLATKMEKVVVNGHANGVETSEADLD